MLEADWFSDIRFQLQCAEIEADPEGFKTKPKPFGQKESMR